MDYDGGDGFAVSSKYFEEMGVLLSLYSNEKCYAIKSVSQSIEDLKRWGGYKSAYSKKTNKEVIGEEYFLESIYKKCDQLAKVLKLKVEDASKIFMPEICCVAYQATKSSEDLSCIDDYFNYMDQIGCSKNEGVCDGGGVERGGYYTIFNSDEL